MVRRNNLNKSDTNLKSVCYNYSMKKYETIKEIINQCEVDIEKDIKCLEFIKRIDFIDIFPISDEHKALLDK